jgi:hypothetical protein
MSYLQSHETSREEKTNLGNLDRDLSSSILARLAELEELVHPIRRPVPDDQRRLLVLLQLYSQV